MSRTTISIGKIAGREILRALGADGEEDEEDDKAGAGNEGGDDGADDENDDGLEDDEFDEEDKKKNPRAVKQAIARKIALKAVQAEKDALAEKLREIENKDKSELEKLQSDYEVLKKKHDSLLGATSTSNMELEALKASPSLKLDWRDLEDVLGWLGRQESVTVEDDGSVKGVKEALKTLAKAKPHWLKSDEDNTGGGTGTGATGANVGGGGNGTKSKKAEARSQLENKYPALRRGRS